MLVPMYDPHPPGMPRPNKSVFRKLAERLAQLANERPWEIELQGLSIHPYPCNQELEGIPLACAATFPR
jgi:hypothetical protein